LSQPDNFRTCRKLWSACFPAWSRVFRVTREDVSLLLDAYDAQLRAHVHDPLPDSVRIEHEGPLLRTVGFGDRGMVEYRGLDGLDGGELDELIARQVRIFAERGEPFEWKLHGHDRPADLPERLRAAGLVPEDMETVLIAPVSALGLEASVPDGVIVREVSELTDLWRIAKMEEAVWEQDHGWIDDLATERAADPDGLRIFVAEAGDVVVCAGWIRFPSGTEFATLWGGATLPAWRGRGIYRALVAHRAKLAAERGRRYIEVDASDDSRPILERLGFVAVTTTTPYVWSPRSSPDSQSAAVGTVWPATQTAGQSGPARMRPADVWPKLIGMASEVLLYAGSAVLAA
jgi:GNAT superfamily N-acetyltransferase